jgi:deoxyribodipyrimidine photo-lyase
MAAYLHFGHVSPIELALKVLAATAPKADADSYVEELIVRRELAVNYCEYAEDYDAYDALPAWAKQTLKDHAADPRPHIYTAAELEAARTIDPYWNAAQTEMNVTGFMHNYMRMYWGKRILEWTQSPREAYETTLRLNNKLFLCGRDPNAYANVGWIYGLHDRPWGPARKIFGTVRYMNAAGLDRKFDMDAYVRRVNDLAARSNG